MRKFLILTLFILATLGWAIAQQPGAMPGQSGGQANPSGSQAPGSMPDASQSQSQMPGTASQDPAAQGASPAAGQSQAASGQVTEGCLGGSNPNYTITDKAGMTYKLNIPPSADASPLASHIGESVQVQGDVHDASKAGKASIDVTKIGRGTGTCPAGGAKK